MTITPPAVAAHCPARIFMASVALVSITASSPAAFGQSGSEGSASQATVQTAAFSPEAILKNIRDLARRLRKASIDVVNDVEQRSMVVTGEPMLIEPVAMKDDDKAIGWAQHMEDLGPPLAPKKKWLDMDINNVGELVTLLSEDLKDVQIPLAQQPAWGGIKAVAQDMEKHYADLKTLSGGPKYDNVAIGKQALKIFDDVKQLETSWKAANLASKEKG